MMTRYAQWIGSCGRFLAVCCGIFCLSPNATGAEVMTSSDVAAWNRVHSQTVTLAWDWSWSWVPAVATQVRVTVRGARHKTVLDQTFAKEDATSVALDIGAVTAESEDVYTAKLAFLDSEGAELSTRSVDLYALAGCFGAARVCTQATTHDDWRKVKGNVLVPYDAEWATDTAVATNGTLTVAPSGRAASEKTFARRSGVLAVRGKGETTLSLSFDTDESTEPSIASLYWRTVGFTAFFK